MAAAGPCEVLQVRQRYSRMADRSVWSSHTTVPGPREEKESVSEEDGTVDQAQSTNKPNPNLAFGHLNILILASIIWTRGWKSQFCLFCLNHPLVHNQFLAFVWPVFVFLCRHSHCEQHCGSTVITTYRRSLQEFRCLFHINGCTHGCGPQFVFLASVKKVF